MMTTRTAATVGLLAAAFAVTGRAAAAETITVTIVDQPRFLPDASCGNGFHEIIILRDASGEHVVGSSAQCDVPADETFTVFLISGTWRLAGGTISWTGTASFDAEGNISFDLDITGGTGTYGDASGTITGGGSAVGPDVTMTAALD